MDITFDHVSFTYQAGTPFAGDGIKDVSGTIHDGSYTAIIGHTGSGKSTILQHLNALLKPTSGTVTIGDKVITNETNNKNLKPLRQKVGMVFQFAENQLFEQTVAKDIAFGPQNFGVSEQDALALADKMVAMVGLPHDVLEKSPSTYLVGKCGGLPLPEYWPCSLKSWFWMSPQLDWIRPVATR